MEVVVNGEPKSVPDAASIVDLLALLGLGSKPVAVELNEQVVRRANHAQTTLKPGDRLEIVTFVGGG